MGTVVLQQAVAVQHAAGAPSWLELGSDVLRTAFALGFVCALAWVALRFLAARGLGKTPRQSPRMELVERLPLDAQRSLVIVRVEQRRLLVGVGPGASPSFVTELESSHAPLSTSSGLSSEELDRIHDAVRRDATH